jgi:hypothetical protein
VRSRKIKRQEIAKCGSSTSVAASVYSLVGHQTLGTRCLQPLRAACPLPLLNNISRAGRALLGLGQWKGEKEGISFIGARRMNAATQTSGQFADNRQPSTAPDGLRCKPIVGNPALYDVARKRQLHPQFWMSTVEFRVSSHVGQQLRYNQPNLPAALSIKLQISRRKQDAYREVIQLVLRDGKAIGAMTAATRGQEVMKKPVSTCDRPRMSSK